MRAVVERVPTHWPRMIKYLGSKRTLIPAILGRIGDVSGVRSVLDVFSGTSRVSHALKRAGYRVIANDHNAYAQTLALCYVQAERARVERDAVRLIAECNALPGVAGYFTETFHHRSRFFQAHNAERIDAIRGAIERKGLEPELKAVMLVSLMEAADRVDSTTGLQMAYLKSWAPRASRRLEMRMPEVLDARANRPCEAHMLDAIDAAGRLDADLAYVDPPYNQHSYLSNYHIWETLVRWDDPAHYGVACKREDCRTRRSAFNSRRTFAQAFEALLSTIRAPHVLISFSDEGFLATEQIEALLAKLGQANAVGFDSKRYVGAQIGVYNPAGKRVGKPTHLRNTEFLYLLRKHPVRAHAAA